PSCSSSLSYASPPLRDLPPFPTRRSSDLPDAASEAAVQGIALGLVVAALVASLGITLAPRLLAVMGASPAVTAIGTGYTRTMLRSEEHTSELQSRVDLVCRLLLEKKN